MLDRRVRTSLISIVTDIFLTSLKGALAVFTGSVAILADAYHSFSDLIVSCTVLIGILLRRRQQRKANDADTDQVPGADESSAREAAAGYWIESLVALFVAMVILYTAYEVVSKVIVSPPDQIRNIWIAVIGITGCVAIAYLISRFKIIVGRETDSPALLADGYHSRMDMFTSIAVLLSLMGQWIGIGLERVVAVLIAVMIATTGLNLLISSFVSLFRKTHVDAKGIWETISSSLGWVVGFVSERLFSRRISLPEIDIARLHPKNWLSRRLVIGLALMLLIVYSISGVRSVQPYETGVRFRFCAIIGEHMVPGLHFALPWPFEKIRKVNAMQIYRAELGFRTDPALVRSVTGLLWEAEHKVPGYRKIYKEAISLSGDEALVDISLVLHYRPLDAVVHLFRVYQIQEVMRGLLESCMREVLANESSGRLMTVDRPRVLKLLKKKISREVEGLGLGVEVVSVFCHDFHPPLEAIPAYRDVFSAREERMKIINEAKSYRNQAIPRARAKGQKEVADAVAFEIEKKLQAKGDAQKFMFTSQAYREAPNVTGYRLYIETIEEGLAGKKKFIANPEANLGGYRLWIFSPKPSG
ncbi:MAG: protease modulator HflK family protein [Deltaproteobacteria bacterium]|nr:protease modulator HflK family protein [Deltaproteobacteria bacterium]